MCQYHRTAALASALARRLGRWLGLALPLGLASIAVPAAAAPPRAAAPLIGDFAYDTALHDGAASDPDPLPIETSEDLQWMIHDSRPHVAAGRAATFPERVGQTAPFRLAHRLGADEVIVPVWTLHL